MPSRCSKILRSLLSLLAFFTSIPIPGKFTRDSHPFDCLCLLPLVGLVRGLMTSLPIVVEALTGFGNPFVTSFAVIAMHYVAQGFLHVDGFIDFSEAVLAHRFGVDGYRVVKDRYRGSYAIATFAVYSIGLFSLMVSLVEGLDQLKVLALLILVEVLSMDIMMLVSYVGREPPEGFGKMFKRNLNARNLATALATSTAIAVAFTLIYKLGLAQLLAITLSAVASLGVSYALASRVLGFVNGDVLGFSSELFYITSLLFLWVSSWI